MEALFELTGVPNGDAACTALLSRRQSLAAVLSSDPHFITSVAGVEAAVACKLAHRIITSALEPDLHARPLLRNEAAVVKYLRACFGHSIVEEVWVLLVDAQNYLINQRVFPGTLDSAHLSTREIMTRALEVGASGLILAHNHPAGSAEPSACDRMATRRLAEAGRSLRIPVLDHLIITRADHFSFRTANLL